MMKRRTELQFQESSPHWRRGIVIAAIAALVAGCADVPAQPADPAGNKVGLLLLDPQPLPPGLQQAPSSFR